jgi:aspartate aminotransferase-like enzyme
MVPGPVSLHPDVLAAMRKDYPSGQVDGRLPELCEELASGLRPLLGVNEASHDIVFMTGEGMLALWSGLKSCLAPGDAVLSVSTGFFGEGIAEMAAAVGAEVERIALPWDCTIGCGDGLSRIEEAVARLRPKMITAVHCETPSGTLNPLKALGEIKKRRRVPLFYVDAVASAGGVAVDCLDRAVDILLVGSQKCLSAPPSMSVMAVSPAAWEAASERKYEGYDALLPFKTVKKIGRFPYTPYWHGLAALAASVKSLEQEGFENVFRRHERVAGECREGLRRLGIDLLPRPGAVPSPTVTAAYVPRGFTFKEWQSALKQRGLIIAGSFGELDGRVFRLGHMGTQADSALMEAALAAVRATLAPYR